MTHAKMSAFKLLQTTALTAAGFLAITTPALAVTIADDALPQGSSVVSGNATMDYSVPGRLDVNQRSQNAVINWTGFNIGKNATTQFNQRNSNSIAVNRVTDINPSQILGTLKANGQVLVLNPNGVMFGKDSHVDVSGLLVSTGDIDIDAFKNNGTIKLFNVNTAGKIDNKGQITIRNSGLAAFVGPDLANSGVIEANLGKIALHAGADSVTVDMYGDGLVELAVDATTSKSLAPAVAGKNGKINNSGTLRANGGKVVLTALAAKKIADSTINMGGVIEANTVDKKNGVIVLDGGTVTVSGKVNAKGGKGKIDVNAEKIDVKKTAEFNTDAGDAGKGGDITLIAQDSMVFAGKAYARGGANSGNGGDIETSGLNALSVVNGSVVDASAANGNAGAWILDPHDVYIRSVGGGILSTLFDSQAISNSAIAAALNGGTNVNINNGVGGSEAGNIHVEDSVVWTGKGALTLDATNNLLLKASLKSSYSDANKNFGAITLLAGNDILGQDFFGDRSIETNTGKITFDAGRDIKIGGYGLNNFAVETVDGNVSFKALRDIVLKGTSYLDLDILTINTTRVHSQTGNINFDAGNDLKIIGGSSNVFNWNSFTEVVADAGKVVMKAANLLVDSGNNTNGQARIKAGGDIKATISGNVDIVGGGTNPVLQSTGGNDITIDNGGVFTSTADSLKTSGTGKIFVRQNVGGSIQNAINALDNSGTGRNTVSLGDGTYTEEVRIKEDNITLTSHSALRSAVTIKAPTVPSQFYVSPTKVHPIVFVDGASNTIVSDLTIDGVNKNKIMPGGSVAGQYYAAIGVFEGDNSVFDNLGLKNTGYGVVSTKSTGTKVKKSTISDVSRDGVFLDRSNDSDIRHNVITKTGHNGIRMVGGMGNSLVNNDITKAGEYGIDLLNTTGANEILRNTIDGTVMSGVNVINSKKTLLDDNEISNTGGHSGVIYEKSGQSTISNNKILNAGWHGIKVLSSDDVFVQDNKVTNSMHDGIYFDNSDRIQVTGNKVFGTRLHNGINGENTDTATIFDNVVEDAKEKGILLTKITGKIDVSENKVRRSGQEGIYATQTNGIQIHDNKVNVAGLSGIALYNSNDAAIERNDIRNTQWDGIRLSNDDRLTVAHNDINNVKRTGIYFYDVNDSTFRKNDINGANEYHGIHGDSSDNARVIHNTIRNIEQDGILLENMTGTTRVRKNNIRNVGDDGIAVINAEYSRIINNNISNTGDDGIYVYNDSVPSSDSIKKQGEGEASYQSVIRGNKIHGGAEEDDNNQPTVKLAKQSVDYIGGDGIEVDGLNGVKIVDNNVKFVDKNGIYVHDTNSATVFDNVVEDSTEKGILLDRLTGNNDVSENKVRRSGQEGIYANEADGIQIHDNKINVAGLSGIALYNSDDAAIERNKIRNIDWDGINLNNNNRLTVAHNDIDDVQRSGIYFYDVNDSTFRKNNINGAEEYHGIHGQSSSDVRVIGNTIRNIAQDGILLEDMIGMTRVRKNKIRNVGDDGIAVINAQYSRIINNNISNTGDDGIYVYNDSYFYPQPDNRMQALEGEGSPSYQSVIRGNKIHGGVVEQDDNDDNQQAEKAAKQEADYIGGDGIEVDGLSNVKIVRNNIKFVDENGIYVHNTGDSLIRKNTIDTSGANGILVTGNEGYLYPAKVGPQDYPFPFPFPYFYLSGSTTIEDNVVSNSVEDGIHVENLESAVIQKRNSDKGNDVSFSGGDGIEVYNVYNSIVHANTVADSEGNGIVITGGYYNEGDDDYEQPPEQAPRLAKSLFSPFGYYQTSITDNTVSDSGDNGIKVTGLNDAFIGASEVVVDEPGDDYPQGKISAAIASAFGNHVTNSKNDGIVASNVDVLEISDNVVDQANNGIHINNSNDVTISRNVVTNADTNGLLVDGLNNGSVVLTDNSFESKFDGATFNSGDISFNGINSFTSVHEGLVFDALGEVGRLMLAGNSFGTTELNVSSPDGYFIRLANGALFAPGKPTILDARQVSFNGFTPGSFVLTEDQYNALEKRLFDYDDENTLGQIFFTFSSSGLTGADFFDILPSQFIGKQQRAGAGSVTITGLPSLTLPNNANSLNNINTAAGPESLNDIDTAAGGNPADADALNDIDTAAGGENASCWNQVYSHFSNASAPVTYSLDSSPSALLGAQSSCATSGTGQTSL